MNIHGISIIKNEADIIAQTLQAAIRWCDFIYIYDNGSTDGTWEILQSLAQKHSQIIIYKQDSTASFVESLRSEVFNYYRSKSQPGDWWCRLDADEIYVDNPRIFLAKVPPQYQFVWSSNLNYYFTDLDALEYEADPTHYATNQPIGKRLRYYLNNWSELRFFRDSEGLKWGKTAWPLKLGRVYPWRIRYRHYQYRSPEQIQRRLDARYQVMVDGGHSFHHELKVDWQAAVVEPQGLARHQETLDRKPSWRDRVVPAHKLDYDAGDGKYIPREDLMPPLPRYNSEWMHHSRFGRIWLRLKKVWERENYV